VKEEVKGQTLEELILWYRDNSELSLKDVSRQLASDLGISGPRFISRHWRSGTDESS
jgi:hypothetical protein